MSDFDPSVDDSYQGRYDLIPGGGLYADIYSTPDFSLTLGDELDLSPIVNVLQYAVDAIPIPADFEYTDNHVRGPYDLSQLNKFYKESGLANVVTTYQDEDGSYYVYINTD